MTAKFSIREALIIHMALGRDLVGKEFASEIMAKVWANAQSINPAHAPRKPKHLTKDVQRAELILQLAENLGEPRPTDSELIEHARMLGRIEKRVARGEIQGVFSEEQAKIIIDLYNSGSGYSSLFPEGRELHSSVSRGKRTLGSLPPENL